MQHAKDKAFGEMTSGLFPEDVVDVFEGLFEHRNGAKVWKLGGVYVYDNDKFGYQ